MTRGRRNRQGMKEAAINSLLDRLLDLPSCSSDHTGRRYDGFWGGSLPSWSKLSGERIWLDVTGSGPVSHGEIEASQEQGPLSLTGIQPAGRTKMG